MAYNQFDVSNQKWSMSTGAQTTIGGKAAANVVVKVLEASFSFDGSTSTATPAQCEFDQCTYATNAPGSANTTSATPAKSDTGRGETIQSTWAIKWTSQPTNITLQWPIAVAQYNGIYHYIHPFVSPFICIGGQGVAVTVNPSASVNFSGKVHAEE